MGPVEPLAFLTCLRPSAAASCYERSLHHFVPARHLTQETKAFNAA
jgi:hypothetical protein